MLNHIADFVVHFDESLAHEQIEQVEDSVRNHACVVSASSHERTPHLMLIAYDPKCTHSRGILDVVKGHGLHAARVG